MAKTTSLEVQLRPSNNIPQNFDINSRSPEKNEEKLQEIFYNKLVKKHVHIGLAIGIPFALIFPPLALVVYGIYCATMKCLVPSEVKKALLEKRVELISAKNFDELKKYVKESKMYKGPDGKAVLHKKRYYGTDGTLPGLTPEQNNLLQNCEEMDPKAIWKRYKDPFREYAKTIEPEETDYSAYIDEPLVPEAPVVKVAGRGLEAWLNS